MSVEAEVYIFCDGCSNRILTRTSQTNMARQRTYASANDWQLAESHDAEDKDYCPECAKEMGEDQ